LADFWLYLLIGVPSGLFAGLLGVGGGLIIVPALLGVFAVSELPTVWQSHLAIGSSLGVIILTSMASMRLHHQRAAVDWSVLQRLAPGLLMGGFLGAQVAALLQGELLRQLFGVVEVLVGVHMLWSRPHTVASAVSPRRWLRWASWPIGSLSSLVGIGGGTLTVPLLYYCRYPLTVAIGTSSAAGLMIALSGAFGYIVTGWSQTVSLGGVMGYLYLPAVIGIALSSIPAATLGAILAHKLPAAQLKKTFAVLLIVVGFSLLRGA